jgi:pyruvate, water dikinase
MTDRIPSARVEFEEHAARLDDELCTWPSEPRLFTRANALDQWPFPITPLTQDLVELPQERALERGFVSVLGVASPSPEWTWNGCFYGYVMFGVTPSAALADNVPGWNRAGVYADYLGVHQDPDAEPEASSNPSLLSVLGIGKNFAGALRSYPRKAQQQIDAGKRQLAIDISIDWPAQSDDALRSRIERFPSVHINQREPHGVASVIGAALFKQLTETVIKLAGPKDGARLATEMITPLGGVHMGQAVEAMALVASGRMAREDFLRKYGFRGSNEFELAARSWSEDPETLDRLIAAPAHERPSPAANIRAAARDRVAKLAGWKWPILRHQLEFTEKHLRWRENGKIPMALGVASMRHVAREAGRRLADRGRIADSTDVFYLRAAELLDELAGRPHPDLQSRVDRRRETHTAAYDLPLPEMVDAMPGAITRISDERWKSLGLLPPGGSGGPSNVLSGIGGAAGTATGRARIVNDPNDIVVDEGDILVARGTDSAWTPLFMQADAVVVDIGGVMSHACIAAREMGIPCVIDVKHGTSRIVEGQKISVDGDAGTVTMH